MVGMVRDSGAGNRLQVMVHHRYADRQGVFEPEANIADTVTDEDDIDANIRNSGRNRIIRGGHDEAPPLLLPPLQHRNGYALNRRFGNMAQSF
jgi:hypothetical protein